jgi:hypothetical protein
VLHRGRFLFEAVHFGISAFFAPVSFLPLSFSSTSLISAMDTAPPFRLSDYPVVIGIDFGRNERQKKS